MSKVNREIELLSTVRRLNALTEVSQERYRSLSVRYTHQEHPTMSQEHDVERKWWITEQTYRAKQLSSQGKAYSLWSASPNIYHDNCYTLRYDISSGTGFAKFGLTHFYPGVKGRELQDVVQEILESFKG